jgi:hypothetical protein
VTGGATSVADRSINLKLGSTATGYYAAMAYSTYASLTASTGTSNGSSWPYVGNGHTTGFNVNFDLTSPFLTTKTMLIASFFDNSGGGMTNGYLNDSTSYTAFTLTPSSGTMTGGTIYVYGYGTS